MFPLFSYLVLGLCYRRTQSCMHVTMLCLTFAYAIFTAPLVPAHLFDNTSDDNLRMTPFKVGFVNTIFTQWFAIFFSFQSMMLYSWYCWMYAINVIIYVVSSSEFRKVYRIFFEDVVAGIATLWTNNCFPRTSDISTPAIELSSYFER